MVEMFTQGSPLVGLCVIGAAVLFLCTLSPAYAAIGASEENHTLQAAMKFDCGFQQQMMRPKMSRHGDTLCYYGIIDAETEKMFQSNLTKDVRFLIVRSSGGEAFISKNIGQMLERLQRQSSSIISAHLDAPIISFFLLTGKSSRKIRL